jgi:hypothetical protein
MPMPMNRFKPVLQVCFNGRLERRSWQELKASEDFSTLADYFYLCDKTGLFRTAATSSKPISKLFVVATQVSHT